MCAVRGIAYIKFLCISVYPSFRLFGCWLLDPPFSIGSHHIAHHSSPAIRAELISPKKQTPWRGQPFRLRSSKPPSPQKCPRPVRRLPTVLSVGGPDLRPHHLRVSWRRGTFVSWRRGVHDRKDLDKYASADRLFEETF